MVDFSCIDQIQCLGERPDNTCAIQFESSEWSDVCSAVCGKPDNPLRSSRLTQSIVRGNFDGAIHHFAEGFFVAKISACESMCFESLIQLKRGGMVAINRHSFHAVVVMQRLRRLGHIDLSLEFKRMMMYLDKIIHLVYFFIFTFDDGTQYCR